MKAPTKKLIEAAEGKHALMPVQAVTTTIPQAPECTVFWDAGSNMNIVRTAWAKKTGRKGTPISRTVYTAGGECKMWDTEMYMIPLKKMNGEVAHVLAMGMEQVTVPLEPVDVSPVMKLFPELDLKDVARPVGDIDLLIGTGETELHPIIVN